MSKNCESCGMPMNKPEDFGGKNTLNKYCVYCTNEKGVLKPFKEKFSDMTNFIMKTSDVNMDAAKQIARETMSKMPAWKNHFS